MSQLRIRGFLKNSFNAQKSKLNRAPQHLPHLRRDAGGTNRLILKNPQGRSNNHPNRRQITSSAIRHSTPFCEQQQPHLHRTALQCDHVRLSNSLTDSHKDAQPLLCLGKVYQSSPLKAPTFSQQTAQSRSLASEATSHSPPRRVRTRIAPSPTGFFHLGGFRTALFNYAYAKKNNGDFLVRIEDTDRTRLVAGSVENLLEMLAWAGITPDESPQSQKQPFGPYVQSERLEIYQKYGQHLLQAGHAYRCFCSTAHLESMRESAGTPTRYDRYCLSLTEEQVQAKLDSNEQFVVRMKVPSGTTEFHDLIQGHKKWANNLVDDQILLKSDNFPTYHLANVVDDHLMEISHVIRGDEWMASTPKHVMLYRFFNWEPPLFAHVPLVLNENGSKISKRNGDLSISQMKESGYLPETIINVTALLGWTPPKGHSEVFTINEIFEHFELDRIHRAPAKIDLKKMKFVNQRHLITRINADASRLVGQVQPALEARLGFAVSPASVQRVIEAVKERIAFVQEIPELYTFFWVRPQIDRSHKFFAKMFIPEAVAVIHEISHQLETNFTQQEENGTPLDENQLLETIQNQADQTGVPLQKVFTTMRLLLTGSSFGIGIPQTISVLGKDESLLRLNKISDLVKNKL